MSFDHQLFIPNKRGYLTGEKRPKVDCILCSVLNNDPKVDNLLIWKNDFVAASINLYPYNSGHILLFPVRHIEETVAYTDEEVMQMHKLNCFAISVLKKLYGTDSFNIGYNVGFHSGASIAHVHQHIVPRYQRELGFIDVISGSKIMIEDPRITMEKLKRAFENFKI